MAQVVDFGGPVSDLKRQTILSLMQHLQAQPFSGFTECVPAYTTLTVYYQATEIAGRDVRADLLTRLHSLTQLTRTSTTRVDIPVCYEQPCAPDLLDVADHCQMTPADVIGLHVKTEHQVLFLGFAPGLPYLRSPSSTLNLPRRTTPRLSVPAGSVAIANGYTVIYPFETPAGWHIIGRTPVKLFKPYAARTTLLQPGDQVRFIPISYREFQESPW